MVLGTKPGSLGGQNERAPPSKKGAEEPSEMAKGGSLQRPPSETFALCPRVFLLNVMDPLLVGSKKRGPDSFFGGGPQKSVFPFSFPLKPL